MLGTSRSSATTCRSVISGSSEAWYRARFGTGRSRVQIPPSRPLTARRAYRRSAGCHHYHQTATELVWVTGPSTSWVSAHCPQDQVVERKYTGASRQHQRED